MITLDGSQGEGGGQIFRTALALSAVTGTPFEITGIRARRAKPGLMRQHLVSVRSAAAICGAQVTGGELGSTACDSFRVPSGAEPTRSTSGQRAARCWWRRRSFPRLSGLARRAR
jgi:RNA 3'-terminal phosphate cyclase (ATP)